MRNLKNQVLPQLPKKWLSHYVGKLAHQEWPQWVNRRAISSFANYIKINDQELEKPLAEYNTIGELFTRKLKEGTRPIQGPRIHPCDGRLIQSGIIHKDVLIQAKGQKYNLQKFIPMNPWVGEFDGGLFSTYYLAPYDYHRVHMPVSGKIRWVSVVPGELWPVNSWSVHNIEGLYALNERVCIGFESEQGKAILTMVGATNVGSIRVSFDRQIKTNQRDCSDPFHRTYPQPHVFKVGDELGQFYLGSTVVVIYSKGFNLKPLRKKRVKMGQPL